MARQGEASAEFDLRACPMWEVSVRDPRAVIHSLPITVRLEQWAEQGLPQSPRCGTRGAVTNLVIRLWRNTAEAPEVLVRHTPVWVMRWLLGPEGSVWAVQDWDITPV